MADARKAPPSPAVGLPEGEGPGKSGEPERDKNKRLLHFGIAFIVLVVAGFLVWLFASGTAGSFFDALTHADPWWVAAGAGCFVGYLLLDSLCYRVAGMLTGVRLGAFDVVSVAAAGIVFGYLTPGQMGGAPAQVVRLAQVGLKVGDATAVQLTKFFIYQMAVTVFGAVVLGAKSSYFVGRFGDVVLVSVLSFVVHVLIMAFLVAVVCVPNIVRGICHLFVRLGSGRIRVFKDPARLHARVDAEVDEYAGSVRTAIRHPGVIVTAVVVTLLQLICLYCAPYCVLRALGVADADFATTLCAAGFVQLIMTAVPLPGGTGGAEGGFALFFGPELGALTAVGVVLWRSLTFYLPIIACAPMLGLRSRLTPDDRLREFGEAHVGYEGVCDAARVVRRRTVELRDAAGEKLASHGLWRRRGTFVVVKYGATPPGRGSWRRRHRLRRRSRQMLRMDDLGPKDDGRR